MDLSDMEAKIAALRETVEEKSRIIQWSDDCPYAIVRQHYTLPFDLYPFQVETVNELAPLPRAGYWMDTGCVDALTEYLSPEGWKKISEYVGGQVAQYWPEWGVIEWVTPTDYVKLPCPEMIQIRSKYGVDQLLSPEHRVLYQSHVSSARHVISAESLAQRHWSKDQGFRGKFITTFRPPETSGLKLSDEELRVQVAVIADGHFQNQNNTCVISVKKARKKERLRTLLTDAGITWKEKDLAYESKQGFTKFVFTAPLRLKEFDSRFFDCTLAQLEVITEEVLHWDGSVSGGRCSFSSSVKASADFVQYAWAATGRRSRVIEYFRDRSNEGRGQSTEYHVHLNSRSPFASINGFGAEVKDNVRRVPSTDGFKYCFMVPSTFLLLRRNGCIFATGNTGKTCTSTVAALFKLIQGADQVLVHLPPILLAGWSRWLKKIPELRHMLYRGSPREREALNFDADFILMSTQIFKKDYERLYYELRDKNVVTLVDECFPSGTEIRVPEGIRAINTLRVGDEVLTSGGIRRISRVFNRLTSQLVTLELSNGAKLRCTPNHPILTDQGWLAAEDCKDQRVLLGSDLSNVQQGIQEEDRNLGVVREARERDGIDLFEILRGETQSDCEPRHPYQRGESSHEFRSFHVGRQNPETQKRGTSIEPVCSTSCKGLEASCEKGEWDGNDSRRSLGCRRNVESGLRMESGDFLGETSKRLPDELQGGFRASNIEDCTGGGWELSLGEVKDRAGQEKGRKIGDPRVVCVSHSKFDDPLEVWNLEVEGCPHYFAGDVLVHNCTSIKNYASDNYKMTKEFVEDRDLLLLSGTPLSTPNDGYAYCKLLAPSLYRNYKHFCNLHVDALDYFGNVTGWKNLDLLAENMKVNAVRILKTDVLTDLPPVTYDPIYYELDPKHWKLYQQLADEQLLPLKDGGKIDGTSEARLHHMLQQIVVNWDYFADDDRLVSKAIELVDEVIDELAGKKLVIFASYRMTNRRLLAHLKKHNAVAAYGDLTVPQQQRNIAKFIDDDKCGVLIGQPTSMGVGVDGLQDVCCDGLFLELPQIPKDFHQAVARLWRDGQRLPVNVRVATALRTLQVRKFKQMLDKDALVNKVQKSYADLRAEIFGEGE